MVHPSTMFIIVDRNVHLPKVSGRGSLALLLYVQHHHQIDIAHPAPC